jgi:nitroimidazol reductase NimA-like FMN-containing flavoprotein (pyridoxamine 5'-phosphate oxidase superfamily)
MTRVKKRVIGGPPKASRPNIPDYGISRSKKGLLPWKWAADRMGTSHQYWVATVRSDGRPHVMPVWGVWVQNAFYFSTGRQTRKARNLASNPRCVICSEDSEEAVIVEGSSSELKDGKRLAEVAKVYKKKYKVDVSAMESPIYCVKPTIVFGLVEKKFPTTATRWKF